MKTEKQVSLFGGICLLIVSFSYLIYGMINNICPDDIICFPSIVLAIGLISGCGFIIWGLWVDWEEEE